jgi:hypothetical protein
LTPGTCSQTPKTHGIKRKEDAREKTLRVKEVIVDSRGLENLSKKTDYPCLVR